MRNEPKGSDRVSHPLDIARSGTAGITSVCSAHPFVIEAALEHGRSGDQVVLIEATSNQVDQIGGYTGMRPADFRAFVERIARRVGFPVERVVLGGDHLGPNRWRNLPAATAMSHVDQLVRSYVAAGYTKLHLDCSYPCADDNGVSPTRSSPAAPSGCSPSPNPRPHESVQRAGCGT
jgi:D-tagatose-1,6-bisphosphate aldolase subunit GatZ/KbaZ